MFETAETIIGGPTLTLTGGIIGRAEIAERPEALDRADTAESVTDGPGASLGELGGLGATFGTEIESLSESESPSVA